MELNKNSIFTINENKYEANKLTPEGQRLLSLIDQTQSEIKRLDIQKTLMQSAQQNLIDQLKRILPPPLQDQNKPPIILGEASNEIPSTGAIKPEQQPDPFPTDIPESLKS